MKRTLAVDVDAATWRAWRRSVPSELTAGKSSHELDLSRTLLMLGTLTMPQLLSRASPARFWAWLRYFLAVSASDDLRITMDFADLDPHQKSILSDDLGVAVSTFYLYEKFAGIAPIIDGRRFMLQFARLLRRKAKPSKAKVGPSKAPDFVFRDRSGRWHILECKGTQSGHGARNHQLKTALAQKNVIQITGGIRGERFASGLSLGNEDDDFRSELRIVDPDDPHTEPLLTLDETLAEDMDRSAQRISIARALGLIGLNDAAAELALPSDAASAVELLRPSEVLRVRASVRDRADRATDTIRRRELVPMEHDHQRYEGRRAQFGYEELGRDAGFSEIAVRQGVSHDFLQELESAEPMFEDKFDERIRARTEHARIGFESDGSRTILTYGDILFAELILRT